MFIEVERANKLKIKIKNNLPKITSIKFVSNVTFLFVYSSQNMFEIVRAYLLPHRTEATFW